MAKVPKISPAEWEVLNIIWDSTPVTASMVHEALSNATNWHPKTVNTFLTRLAEKGIVSIHRDGKANVYTPNLPREQCVGQESESFLQRVFRGATVPLLAHFCERADLSDAEIEHLQKLLQQRVRKARKK